MPRRKPLPIQNTSVESPEKPEEAKPETVSNSPVAEPKSEIVKISTVASKKPVVEIVRKTPILEPVFILESE